MACLDTSPLAYSARSSHVPKPSWPVVPRILLPRQAPTPSPGQEAELERGIVTALAGI